MEERLLSTDVITTVSYARLSSLSCTWLPHLILSQPCAWDTRATPVRADQKRPEIRKSNPSSGFLEARDGGEGSAEGVILNVFFFNPFPDSFMYSVICVFLL